jgi:hypothetical protein
MRHPQRRWLAVLLLTACATVSDDPKAPAISFDADAASLLLDWAKGGSTEISPGWRSLRAYELTRRWGAWNGRTDTDEYVEKRLRELAGAGTRSIDVRIGRARDLLAAAMAKRTDFVAQATLHLRAYLPAGTPINGVAVFAVCIPTYAFSWGDGTIVVDLSDGFWRGSTDKLFNLLLHELFHNGFIRYQRGVSASDAANGEALIDHLLWQTQNEGMATYVAYRAKPASLAVEDYRLLESADEVSVRARLLQQLLEDCAVAGVAQLPALRERAREIGDAKRAYYVVGAHMAQVVEARNGRAALVATIEQGPRAFFEAYARSASASEPGIAIPRKRAASER